jgi:hypothetical protein
MEVKVDAGKVKGSIIKSRGRIQKLYSDYMPAELKNANLGIFDQTLLDRQIAHNTAYYTHF